MSEEKTGEDRILLAGRKHAPASLGDVLILGLGKSGCAAADFCLARLGSRVESVTIAAGARESKNEEAACDFEVRGARVLFERYAIEGSYDLCIASPGISQFEDFYRSAQAASREIISEVEFAWRESAASSCWVAVTGTNGKTTVTALIAHILSACESQMGKRIVAVGNIGDTCLDAVAADAADVYVSEVSSYQLASTRYFAPNVAVLLNITPDHIHWHKTHEAYVAAKKRIYANLSTVKDGIAVMDATDDEVRSQIKSLKAQGDEQRGFAYIPVGARAGLSADMHEVCGSANAAFLCDGMLQVRLGERVVKLVKTDELLVKGEHNAGNCLAAGAACLALGADEEMVRSALRTFAPLEHRIEPCGYIGGIECYNDSKATNVDATLKALAAFGEKKPIVLLGGDDKGTSLDELVAATARHCKAAVCFGAAEERFEAAFADVSIPVLRAPRLEAALDAALSIAQPGDIVLLSPACASFDEFTCFEERGDAFKGMVRARSGDGV